MEDKSAESAATARLGDATLALAGLAVALTSTTAAADVKPAASADAPGAERFAGLIGLPACR